MSVVRLKVRGTPRRPLLRDGTRAQWRGSVWFRAAAAILAVGCGATEHLDAGDRDAAALDAASALDGAVMALDGAVMDGGADAAAADSGSSDAGTGLDSGADAGGSAVPVGFDRAVPPGFPNSTTTGPTVPESMLTVYPGDLSSSRDGEVIERCLVMGALNIRHANVVVRNCRVYGAGFWAVNIDGPDAIIEDSEIGLPSVYATLTSEVSPGATSIFVDTPVPVGAYLILSSDSVVQRTLRVRATSGAGPYQLELERHYQSAGTIQTGPPDIMEPHPAGATISIYDPATMPPLPDDGIKIGPRGARAVVRRCDIHHVNDGSKIVDGTLEDSYIHELVYVPPSHLDSVQTTNGTGAVIRHNTLMLTIEANGMQLSPSQGPVSDMTIEYNYIVGGGWSLRWYIDGGRIRYNRFGRSYAFGPLLVRGAVDEIRDNRHADDGSVVGPMAIGDRDGDGTGTATSWGTGADPRYALP